MHIAVFTTFAASRKEPLVDTVERVHAAFPAAGFGDPRVRFALSDHAVTPLTEAIGVKRVSSIERVLKRWPELERFVRDAAAAPGTRATYRVISNLTVSGVVDSVDFDILREIARGVPKSFPFQKATLHFSAAGFSEGPELPAAPDRQTLVRKWSPLTPASVQPTLSSAGVGAAGGQLTMLMRAGVDIGAGHPTTAGISVQDAWWVNGRQRSMAALRIVEADPSAKKLPAPPARIASLFAACGKVRKTVQVPMAIAPAAAQSDRPARPDGVASDKGEAIRSVVRAYRARIPDLLEKLPHDIPHREPETTPLTAAGLPASGPKKPELVHAFAPLGYYCRGDTGTFTLRRRTPGNLTVKLQFDVGTWSNSIMAFMQVEGLLDGQGFKATLNLPVSRSAVRGVVHGVELAGQLPIGGPDRWKQIVENLAALVAELDRSFVAEIEVVSGPSP